MSDGGASILQLRSSAGLYGADRMVLALNQGLNRTNPAAGDVQSRLLSINNYRMDRQPVHDAAIASDQPAELLPCAGRLDRGTVRALATTIRDSQAQVLHAHDYKSAFYAWLASRIEPVMLVATLHGQVGTSRSLRFYNRLELALLRRFDALVVVAADQTTTLRSAGIAASRIHQIDNGIELPDANRSDAEATRSSARVELGIDDADFVFAAVGRLSPEKNLAMLLSAFAGVAGSGRATLLLIGDGPERTELAAQIAELGIQSSVRMLGVRHDMQRLYPAMDCLVLPSLSEGMPLVVLEAMAHALPVIASRVGDVPRLLSHAEYASLIAVADADALRDALLNMLDRSRVRDIRARDYAHSHHSPQAMAARYLALYQSLLVRSDVSQSA